MAVISANSEQRDEGYFRREWRLAIERAGDMAEKKAFLVPVVIDGTSERGASVPDKFREVHWSHAPDGQASPAFIERMRHLLSPGPSHSPIVTQGSGSPMSGAEPAGQGLPHSWVSRPAILVFALILIAGGAYVALDHFMKRSTPASTATADKSIAVLPFADLSEKHDQEYFADGMAEEIIQSAHEDPRAQGDRPNLLISVQGEG